MLQYLSETSQLARMKCRVQPSVSLEKWKRQSRARGSASIVSVCCTGALQIYCHQCQRQKKVPDKTDWVQALCNPCGLRWQHFFRYDETFAKTSPQCVCLRNTICTEPQPWIQSSCSCFSWRKPLIRNDSYLIKDFLEIENSLMIFFRTKLNVTLTNQ